MGSNTQATKYINFTNDTCATVVSRLGNNTAGGVLNIITT